MFSVWKGSALGFAYSLSCLVHWLLVLKSNIKGDGVSVPGRHLHCCKAGGRQNQISGKVKTTFYILGHGKRDTRLLNDH